MNEHPRIRTRVTAVVLFCAVINFSVPASRAQTNWQDYEITLPALNPSYSPLAEENRPLLFNRLMIAFAKERLTHEAQNRARTFSDGMTVYYLQRELQAFVDMWQATGYLVYLDQATSLTQQALREARAAPRLLIWHGEPRGVWPCFYLDTVAAETGGHNQLIDFQGSAGLLLVARCLQQINRPEWRDIAEFVERDIVEKWLYYKPSITQDRLTGPESLKYLLVVLNSGRDVREHFACLCLDLQALGYRRYPYRDWAKLLIDLYLTPRYDVNEPAPYQNELAGYLPADWGLFDRTEEDYVWYSIPGGDPNDPLRPSDTSHANRTAWLAARACTEGLINKSIVLSLANTFRYRIWAPDKGPFYFNNYVDGSDGDMDGLEGGRGGNIWFGWHRLAAFDEDLAELFLSLAYDLTNGGPNLPYGAQNKTMRDAPLCLEAWATRLLSAKGQIPRFP